MKIQVLLILLISIVQSNAQPFEKDKIYSPTDFQFVNYSILDSTIGHLNENKRNDLVLILKSKAEDTLSGFIELKRPLYILLAIDSGKYKLDAQSEGAIQCSTCGGVFGDPYVETIIKEDTLKISHYGGSSWRWGAETMFKRTPKGWYLVKNVETTFHSSRPEETEKITITTPEDFGEVSLQDFSHY